MEKHLPPGQRPGVFRRRASSCRLACSPSRRAARWRRRGEGPRPEEGRFIAPSTILSASKRREAGNPAPATAFHHRCPRPAVELAALKTEGAAPLCRKQLNALVPPLQAALGKAGAAMSGLRDHRPPRRSRAVSGADRDECQTLCGRRPAAPHFRTGTRSLRTG